MRFFSRVTAFLSLTVFVCSVLGAMSHGQHKDGLPAFEAKAPMLAKADAVEAEDTSPPPAKKGRVEEIKGPLAQAHLATPKRKPQASADLTPGQWFAKKRSETLNRAAVETIAGAEFVESLGLRWDLIEDPETPIDDALLRHNLFRLSNALDDLHSDKQDEGIPESVLSPLYNLWSEAFNLRTGTTKVHRKRVRSKAQEYFTSGMFAHCAVKVRAKRDGVQLGNRVLVTFPGDELPVTYYVKTHAKGLVSEKSTAAKAVDARELFVYKLLEYVGVGCQTHIFHRSLEDVYIATLDANIVHQPPEGERPEPTEDRNFVLFEEVSNRKRDKQERNTLGETLWGNLYGAILNNQSTKDDWKECVEACIVTDEKAKVFVRELVLLDVLSRILHLRDFLNNSDNIGFVRQPGGSIQARAIDFRLDPTQEIFLLNEIHFQGFLAGNGLFRYDVAHDTLGYTLHERAVNLRVREALGILEGRLQNFEKAATDAADFVASYLQEHEAFQENRIKMIAALNTYRDAAIQNAAFFKEQFAAHLEAHPEN